MTDASKKRIAIYPVVYMFVVTFILAGVLVVLARATEERVEANREIAFERAMLDAADMHIPEDADSLEVHRLFGTQIKWIGSTLGGGHVAVSNGVGVAYLIPFEGQGFWNQIKGVVGVNTNMTELTGIAFYEQNETPGLGAEIVKPYFCDQFKNLRIAQDGESVRFIPAGTEKTENDVNAITGASQTCTRLDKILNEALERLLARAES